MHCSWRPHGGDQASTAHDPRTSIGPRSRQCTCRPTAQVIPAPYSTNNGGCTPQPPPQLAGTTCVPHTHSNTPETLHMEGAATACMPLVSRLAWTGLAAVARSAAACTDMLVCRHQVTRSRLAQRGPAAQPQLLLTGSPAGLHNTAQHDTHRGQVARGGVV